jgi:hypothetical protein
VIFSSQQNMNKERMIELDSYIHLVIVVIVFGAVLVVGIAYTIIIAIAME